MIGYLAAMLLLIGADRALKIFMAAWLSNGPIPVIDGVVRFRYVENTGMAFGWLSGRLTLLIVATVILICALLFYFFYAYKASSATTRIALAMIIAGGLGNLYDRVFVGYVVDYVEPLFVNFAVFNLADALVNVGCVLLVIGIIVEEIKKPRAGKPKKEEN